MLRFSFALLIVVCISAVQKLNVSCAKKFKDDVLPATLNSMLNLTNRVNKNIFSEAAMPLNLIREVFECLYRVLWDSYT